MLDNVLEWLFFCKPQTEATAIIIFISLMVLLAVVILAEASELTKPSVLSRRIRNVSAVLLIILFTIYVC